MNRNPKLGKSLTDEWIQTSNSLLERMLNNFKCKLCGNSPVVKITIISSHPVDAICESCQRNEKIENLLK